MFISVIKPNLAAAAACIVATFCFTLLYLNSRRRRKRVVVEWPNLPADILFLIAQRSEIRHLRAVCSSWRSSLPLPCKAHHPLLSAEILLPLALFAQDHHLRRDDLSAPSYLTLTELNIYCLEPLGNDDADSPESCWIVKLEEMSSGIMRFYHTLSYWSISASRLNLPAVVDFLDCRIILVGKEYTFKDTYNMFFSCKVVLSDDAMLCLFDKTKLGYFKFGGERWAMIVEEGKDELANVTTDIIYHKQKFYAIDRHGLIMVIDSSLKVEAFVSPARVDGQWNKWFFVQSDGDLFVVYKYIVWDYVDYHGYRVDDEQGLVHFKVYRFISDEQQWYEVTDLGDQSFFISSGCAFSIGSGQFYGCGKNFIYCDDRTFDNYGSLKPGYDIGIFSLEDNSSRPLHKISRYSRLFWPIPSWLNQGWKLRNTGLRRFLFK